VVAASDDGAPVSAGEVRPIENCYPVAERFFAGEYPRTPEDSDAPPKLVALLDAGVTLFVDLTEPDERTWKGPLRPYADLLPALAGGRARHLRVPIRDVSVPARPELVVEALRAIDAERSRGGTVYLHCLGGVGRTGTIVGCWLAGRGHPGEAALERLRELWQANPKSASRRSPETREQEAYIVAWPAGDPHAG
jgi:hypothetical protein